jgi:hypothetical protein
MNLEEFSNGFDVLASSYRRFKDFDDKEILDSIEFNEYEKSLFLTSAQEQLVLGYYSGKNSFGESFEATEEVRRQLDSLVKTKKYTIEDEVGERIGVDDKSVFFSLPDNLAFITLEQVEFDDKKLGCYNHSVVNVYPTKQDEFNKIKNNPFRGATKYKVLRLDSGDNVVEIVSKYTIDKYLIRYVEKPEPIILENLPEGLTIEGVNTANPCKLNSILHNIILERAVLMALRTKTNTER